MTVFISETFAKSYCLVVLAHKTGMGGVYHTNTVLLLNAHCSHREKSSSEIHRLVRNYSESRRKIRTYPQINAGP